MNREDIANIWAFAVVAREGSFTGAARQMGTSQSALSRTIKRLEDSLGTRLLERSSRRVAPTAAGARLLQTLVPSFEDIVERVEGLDDAEHRVRSRLRVRCPRDAVSAFARPLLAMSAAPEAPQVLVVEGPEFEVDAWVRPGPDPADGIQSTPLGSPRRMALVASPQLIRNWGPLEAPHELSARPCLATWRPGSELSACWRFTRGGAVIEVFVRPVWTAEDPGLVRAAAQRGLGFAYLSESYVGHALRTGALSAVLEESWLELPAYHLCFPAGRDRLPGIERLLDALGAEAPGSS